MALNGSVRREFINDHLEALRKNITCFENGFPNNYGEFVDTSYLFKNIYRAFERIVEEHCFFDADSIIELLVDYFLKPLKRMTPARWHFGAYLDVRMKQKKMILKIIDQEEVGLFVKSIHEYDDAMKSNAGINIIENWLVIIKF